MIKRFEIFNNNISTIYKGIQQLKKEAMKKFGLKGNHVMCLFYLLKHNEGLTISQLSEKADIDKAAISRSLSELFQSNYIYYPNFNGGKKYNNPALLTDKGIKITNELNDIIFNLVDKISLTNISEDDRTIMYRSLKTIANNINNCLEGGEIL